MTTVAVASRERILDEAARLFMTYGYLGISMREIGEATGISKAGLYYHFKDKEDLLIAILTKNLDQIGEIMQINRAEGVTTRNQICQIILALFSLPPEQRAIIRLASQEMMHLTREARSAFDKIYQERFIGRLASILAVGCAQGELQLVDPQLATWILLGMLYPFFHPNPDRPQPVNRQTIETILGIFFDGLAVK